MYYCYIYTNVNTCICIWSNYLPMFSLTFLKGWSRCSNRYEDTDFNRAGILHCCCANAACTNDNRLQYKTIHVLSMYMYQSNDIFS